MIAARRGIAAMAEATGENPLEEIKGQIKEVIELLNEPNFPVTVNDEGAKALEPVDPKE